jgi:hypothetical protein
MSLLEKKPASNRAGEASMSPTRRNLRFHSISDVMPDVERLLTGHVTVGRWSLGQILNHLELASRLSMDGVPVKFSWLLRRLFGPMARRLSFWLGWIPEQVRVPSVYLPAADLDAAREAAALRQSVARLQTFTGAFDEHPLLGRLSPEQWLRFHCLHCAHHLSFAVPV